MNTEGERLQKVLAHAGIASRRVCEQMIADGRVEVNGEVVTEMGRRVDPAVDVIHVDSARVVLDADHLTIAFNKPTGVVSTMNDPEGRPTLADFMGRYNTRLFHVGRLDTPTQDSSSSPTTASSPSGSPTRRGRCPRPTCARSTAGYPAGW